MSALPSSSCIHALYSHTSVVRCINRELLRGFKNVLHVRYAEYPSMYIRAYERLHTCTRISAKQFVLHRRAAARPRRQRTCVVVACDVHKIYKRIVRTMRPAGLMLTLSSQILRIARHRVSHVDCISHIYKLRAPPLALAAVARNLFTCGSVARVLRVHRISALQYTRIKRKWAGIGAVVVVVVVIVVECLIW